MGCYAPLTPSTYLSVMRTFATSLLVASLLLGASSGASGHSSSLEWLTFNEVTLNGHKRVLSKHNISPEEFWYSSRRRQLAYVPYYADGIRSNRLWIADVDSPADRLVYEAPAWITDVAWSPDGKTIAFVSGEIWLIAPDGSNLRRIGEPGAFPAWSPDSSEIAYMVLTGGHWLIRILSLASGSTRDLVLGQNFRWSPHGTRIAYEKVGGGSCKIQVRIVTLQTGTDRAVACGSQPTWSPDGKRIALVRYDDHTTSLWIVSSRGGTPRRLATARGGGAEAAVWSPNSRWIAFRQATRYCASTLALVRLDGSRPRRLASHTRIVVPLAVAGTGRKILYAGERCSNQ
jgi:Tol biopolymer transport system component